MRITTFLGTNVSLVKNKILNCSPLVCLVLIQDLSRSTSFKCALSFTSLNECSQGEFQYSNNSDHHHLSFGGCWAMFIFFIYALVKERNAIAQTQSCCIMALIRNKSLQYKLLLGPYQEWVKLKLLSSLCLTK